MFPAIAPDLMGKIHSPPDTRRTRDLSPLPPREELPRQIWNVSFVLIPNEIVGANRPIRHSDALSQILIFRH